MSSSPPRNLRLMFCVVIWLFLSSWSAACPLEVASLCKCAVYVTGLQLDCSLMNLTDVVAALKQANTRIQRLTMHNSQILDLPSGVFGDLWIKELDLSKANLTTVSVDAFTTQQQSSMETLRLANNSLSSVPFLNGFQNLAVVDLSGNQISNVTPGAFDQLPSLQVLRLSRNRICNLEPMSFNETKGTVTLLDLAGNCLDRVPAQNLRGFQRLAWLDLSGNQISDLPNLVFTNLAELRELHLENNKITTLASMAFMNVGNLQSLYLSGNQLSTIDANQFQTFENLEILDLSRNNLRKVPSAGFRDLRDLQQLFLDGNKITSLETLSFSNLQNLQLLSLQQNQIVQFSRNTFDQLPALVILLLAHNALTSIDQGMLAGVPNLQQVGFRNNSIAIIDKSCFDLVPYLTTLDLAQNKLRNLTEGTFAQLAKLHWLDLSQNQLERIAAGALSYHVANILLYGNPLNCSQDFDWFVDYLVRNNVRTFLSDQPDVTCAVPNGTRLKDLMIMRANDSFYRQPSPEDLANTLTNIPGAPQPPATIPGYPGLDLSKIPPEIVRHVLQGGAIPGVPQEVLQGIVRQYMQGGSAAAQPTYPGATTKARGPGGVPSGQLTAPTPPSSKDIVPVTPPSSFPSAPFNELVQNVIKGDPIPGFSPEQVEALKKHYLSVMLSGGQTPESTSESSVGSFEFDLTGLHPDVLKDLARGRLPDLTLVPLQFVEILQANPGLLTKLQQGIQNMSKEDSPNLLPGVASGPNGSPYNLDTMQSAIDNGNALPREAAWITGTVLGVIAGVTFIVLVIVCCRRRFQLRRAVADDSSSTGSVNDRDKFFQNDMGESPKSSLATVLTVPQLPNRTFVVADTTGFGAPALREYNTMHQPTRSWQYDAPPHPHTMGRHPRL